MTMLFCAPKELPADLQVVAMRQAAIINPANSVPEGAIDLLSKPEHLAVMRSKYWGAAKGCVLTVQFLDNPDQATRKKILEYANLWNKKANIKFSETNSGGDVRIARERDGYWSYLGTDILHIPRNEPTMNLEGFTSKTSDREYGRVVPHEFGHTAGFPHEHMRATIISRLDRNKTYAYMRQTSGWSKAMVDSQVFTPLPEGSIIATNPARENSIMCYAFPGSITKDGKPIVGGDTISQLDYDLARKVYPKNVL